ncbi:hypothetical protein SFRURICE_004664 [Spodoptera frugiperda]|nr:hypothetical protein SFRURICE_004664 [Spodoptera frugiperda]
MLAAFIARNHMAEPVASAVRFVLFFDYLGDMEYGAAERNSTLKNRNPTVTNLDSQTSSTTAVSGIPRTTITDLPTIGERQILLHGEHGAKGMRIRGVALFMSTGSERLGIAFCNTTHQKWLTISPGLASLLNGSTSKTSMRRRVFEALPEIKLVGQSCRLLRMRNKTIAMFSGVDAVTCFEQACKVLSGISKWGQVEGVQSRVISVDAAVVASEKGKIADLMGCVQASEYHEVIVYEDRGEDLSFLRKPVQDPPSVGSLSGSERLQQRHLEQSALQQQQRNAERQHKERTSRSNLCNLTYKTDKLHWHCWNRLTAACAETSCIPKCSTVGGDVGWVAPFPTKWSIGPIAGLQVMLVNGCLLLEQVGSLTVLVGWIQQVQCNASLLGMYSVGCKLSILEAVKEIRSEQSPKRNFNYSSALNYMEKMA